MPRDLTRSSTHRMYPTSIVYELECGVMEWSPKAVSFLSILHNAG